MALSHGRSLTFWVATPSGGASASLSTTTQEVTGLPGDVDLGDVTAGGATAHAFYPGLQNATFSTKHVFDDAAGGSWAKLGSFQSLQQTYPTVPWGIIFAPRGTTAGAPQVACNALISNLNVATSVTEPNTFTVSWQMTGSSGASVGVWT